MTIKHRLNLNPKELALIKGLTKRADLNDQIITAMFSHRSRSINHRVIGMIRKGRPPYELVSAATDSDVEHFLRGYDRFERMAKDHGIVPAEPEFQLLARGRDAMIAAISAYNSPTLQWKAETFIVNAIIAWTYLHHAHFTKTKVDFTYKDKNGPVLLPNGKPKLWELSKCIAVNACPLSTPAKKNLEYLIEIRNEIEHRKSENIDAFVLSKMQACAINFNRYIVELFGAGFSLSPEHGLAIQLAQISPLQHQNLKGDQGLPAIVAAVNKNIEEPLAQADYDSLEYSYRVFVMPRTTNNKSKADEAVTLLPPDVEANLHLMNIALKEVERKKYRAKDIIAALKKEGFKSINMHTFVTFWRSVDGKNPKHALGADIAGTWYWYESMTDRFRQHLQKAVAKAP